jgi:hexosaminidase
MSFENNLLEQVPYIQGYEPSTISSETIVQGGVSRALSVIFTQGLYPWMFHLRNETDLFEPSLSRQTSLKKLAITQTGKDTSSTFKPLAGQVDESYGLTISTNGEATISAVSSIGILRALETFTQLFYTYSTGNAYYTPYAPVRITDSPVFPHRGVLLDTSRNYYSVSAILRTIDGCAASKLNVLHLHATDSQSWPLVIPSLPELSAKGAYRSDLVYTPADLKQIQEYGVARGVEVIYEIDQPGHISSLGWSYPELLTAYNFEPYTEMCAEPPCGQISLNNSAVDPFLDTLMDDLLPRLYPYSAYFHCGGDEINANDSAIDPAVGTNASDVVAALLQTYTDKSFARVRKAGLTPMVWEEIPLDWNVTLGSDVVVQSWLGPSSVSSLTSMGYKVVDSNFNYLVSFPRM